MHWLDTELNLLMGIAAFDRDLMEADSSKRIVLLGDAAHPMSPFKVKKMSFF